MKKMLIKCMAQQLLQEACREWDELSNNEFNEMPFGYPESLPSFDELVILQNTMEEGLQDAVDPEDVGQ